MPGNWALHFHRLGLEPGGVRPLKKLDLRRPAPSSRWPKHAALYTELCAGTPFSPALTMPCGSTRLFDGRTWDIRFLSCAVLALICYVPNLVCAAVTWP